MERFGITSGIQAPFELEAQLDWDSSALGYQDGYF